MKHPPSEVEAESSPRVSATLGLGWSVDLDRTPLGAVLRLRHANRAPVDVEICLTANGPVVRTAASSLEIVAANEVVARCERFSVEASERVTIRAPEVVQEASGAVRIDAAEIGITASLGDVRVRANDDVQLLGEQVLLNCERQPPVPRWVPAAAAEDATVPRQDSGGDANLLRDSLGEK